MKKGPTKRNEQLQSRLFGFFKNSIQNTCEVQLEIQLKHLNSIWNLFSEPKWYTKTEDDNKIIMKIILQGNQRKSEYLIYIEISRSVLNIKWSIISFHAEWHWWKYIGYLEIIRIENCWHRKPEKYYI